MNHVYWVLLWAKSVNSLNNYSHWMGYVQGADLASALLPLYETIEHIRVTDARIICSFPVDTPLEF